jgi:predicted flavoprotein YhiN
VRLHAVLMLYSSKYTCVYVLTIYEQVRVNSARREVSTFCPLEKAAVPKRLWKALTEDAGIGRDEKWGECSNAKITALAKNAAACILNVKGKGAFKDEFVTCGGLSLNDINMKVSTSHFCNSIVL